MARSTPRQNAGHQRRNGVAARQEGVVAEVPDAVRGVSGGEEEVGRPAVGQDGDAGEGEGDSRLGSDNRERAGLDAEEDVEEGDEDEKGWVERPVTIESDRPGG